MELYLTSSKSEREVWCIIGQTGCDVYNTMTFYEEETDEIAVLFGKFESYCKPKQNMTIGRYHFNMMIVKP